MTGFSKAEVETLDHIYRVVHSLFRYETDMEKHHLSEYWESDQVLLPSIRGRVPLSADCEEHAMLCLHRAVSRGFHARLVVCLDETDTGHCICEVASEDQTEAYYFDNRRTGLATRQSLIGYTFYSVSPWNPEPGDQRPWHLVES